MSNGEWWKWTTERACEYQPLSRKTRRLIPSVAAPGSSTCGRIRCDIKRNITGVQEHRPYTGVHEYMSTGGGGGYMSTRVQGRGRGTGVQEQKRTYRGEGRGHLLGLAVEAHLLDPSRIAHEVGTLISSMLSPGRMNPDRTTLKSHHVSHHAQEAWRRKVLLLDEQRA